MASSAPGKDVLGFSVPILTQQQEQDRQASNRTAETATQKWNEKFGQEADPYSLPRTRLKRFIRKRGVPLAQRTRVWSMLSGADELRESQARNYFSNLVTLGEQQSKSLHQIELDLPRTFPEHEWLHGADGQAALRSVLVAYSMHNSKAGYCQGLNFVTATLLVATNRQPETAFWLLVALLDRILYPGMYAPWLPGYQVADKHIVNTAVSTKAVWRSQHFRQWRTCKACRVSCYMQIEMRALGKLVSKKLGGLHRHLEQLGCDMQIVATDWFLCLFVTTLPHETCLRVLDCLFCEGPKILYRVSLALLKEHQDMLMKQDNTGELLHVLKRSVTSEWGIDKVLDVCFNGIGGMPMARINRYRAQFKPEIDAMVRDREATARQQEAKEAERQQQRVHQQQPATGPNSVSEPVTMAAPETAASPVVDPKLQVLADHSTAAQPLSVGKAILPELLTVDSTPRPPPPRILNGVKLVGGSMGLRAPVDVSL